MAAAAGLPAGGFAAAGLGAGGFAATGFAAAGASGFAEAEAGGFAAGSGSPAGFVSSVIGCGSSVGGLYQWPAIRVRRGQAQSSAPLRHAYTYPMTRMNRKTSISMSPNSASSSMMTAHGNMNTVSTSKITNSIATR